MTTPTETAGTPPEDTQDRTDALCAAVGALARWHTGRSPGQDYDALITVGLTRDQAAAITGRDSERE